MKGYPANPKPIGKMIRKRRLDLGLTQKDVAKILGCAKTTVWNWEQGCSEPSINYMGGVVKFLGYNPFEKCNTMAQRLVNHRKAHGITQKSLSGNWESIKAPLRGGNTGRGSLRDDLKLLWKPKSN
jgi:DNA-binding XRE family transcriptional regulator